MTRKNFWIQVGWHEPRGLGDGLPQLFLNSNTLVLGVRTDMIQAPFDVERIPGSWSKHIPEKTPRYRVTWGGERIEVEPTRLQSLGSGRDILIPLTANRPQTCLNYKGLLHGVYHNRSGCSPHTYCGENPHISRDDLARGDLFVGVREVTCRACLTFKAVWCLYTIFAYEDKGAKRVKKTEEKRLQLRLRLPTAYARILDDDLFENPTYKPVKQRVITEVDVDETEDFANDPRDRKRASAIDRNRRLEASKARVQGHRR